MKKKNHAQRPPKMKKRKAFSSQTFTIKMYEPPQSLNPVKKTCPRMLMRVFHHQMGTETPFFAYDLPSGKAYSLDTYRAYILDIESP